MAYPNFPLDSHWTQHIPTAVNGVVPNWSNLDSLIYNAYRNGIVVTYNDASGYQFILNAATSTEYRFNGRIAFGYPSATKARIYRVTITRSSGAVTSTTTDFTIS